jgi:hypothetical protein
MKSHSHCFSPPALSYGGSHPHLIVRFLEETQEPERKAAEEAFGVAVELLRQV